MTGTGEWTNAIIAVVVAIIGLATLSVVLSKSANTTGVIQAGSTGLANVIKAAVSPVTGFAGVSTSVLPLSEYGGSGSF